MGSDLGPATEFKVCGDAQVAPLPVGFDPRDVILLRQTNRVAAEQQPEGWLIYAGDLDADGRGLTWIPRLRAVIVALNACYRAIGRSVFRTDAAHRGGP